MRMFGAAVLNTSTGHVSGTALVRQLLGYVTDWRIHLVSACTHPLFSHRSETSGAAIPEPELSGSASFATLRIATADSPYSGWHCAGLGAASKPVPATWTRLHCRHEVQIHVVVVSSTRVGVLRR